MMDLPEAFSGLSRTQLGASGSYVWLQHNLRELLEASDGRMWKADTKHFAQTVNVGVSVVGAGKSPKSLIYSNVLSSAYSRIRSSSTIRSLPSRAIAWPARSKTLTELEPHAAPGLPGSTIRSRVIFGGIRNAERDGRSAIAATRDRRNSGH
jgi:hypothetical protein